MREHIELNPFWDKLPPLWDELAPCALIPLKSHKYDDSFARRPLPRTPSTPR